MDICDIRRINMLELIDRFDSQAKFAEKINKPTSYISQIKRGEKKNGDKVSMGNDFARDIELALDLPRGWLDVIYKEQETQRRFIPVKGTAQMGNNGFWDEIDFQGNGGDGYLEIHNASEKSYVIRAKGNSMFPAIRAGWYVAFDPTRDPCSGEYVHIVLKNGQNMIKEFVSCQHGMLNLISVNGMERLSFDLNDVEVMNPFIGIQPPSRLLDESYVLENKN